ncbi:hypothetical protein Ancab_004333 [Ancistrocladus abbreviatus]
MVGMMIWENELKKILQFIREVPEWINYNNEIAELVQSLKNRLERLDCVVNDVEGLVQLEEFQPGKKRRREVDDWLRNVRSKNVDVQNMENHISGVSHLAKFFFREWLQSRLEKKIREVDELLERGNFSGRPLVEATQTKLELPVGKEIHGQDTAGKKCKIFNCLKNLEISMIGVEGVRGIGKSFILTHIHNELLAMTESYDCDCIYYVNVAKDDSLPKLQASIAKAIGLEMNDTDTRKRAARICSALKMKRFVLILDDLSLFFTTDEVGIPLEENKGKLILATQPPLVCRRMRCQKVIKLEPFPYEDAEKFFMKKLGRSDYPSEEIRKIAGDIIRKCGGIPSKIQTMAVNLRGVDDIHEWRSTFSDMED